MRIGHGYDVHKLVPARPLVLGGVTIEFALGLAGHSDADVLTHAVMDALLGAAALGDIGLHFPPGELAYKDANSIQLLHLVYEKVTQAGYVILNIDSTVIAQAPKLAAHVPAMREIIATACSLALEQVSVKATTEEGLGFTGAGQGIAAHAIVLLGVRQA